ncbi:MAG: molybdopterin-guanine dinucleotide biosynthesis protein B [Nitrospirota bacterium]
MIPIVSIVGKSNSGKTTLIAKVIPILVKKGYRIATIKHCAHGFEMDKEGKDTWKHKKAGAKAIVAVSDKRLALITDIKDRYKLEEIRERFIDDVDLIIAEGYKTERYQKIEVLRNGNSKKLLCSKDDNLIAVVSDRKIRLKGVLLMDLNKPKDVAGFIEQRFLKNKKRLSRKEKAYLFVNGRKLIIKPFVQEWFAKSIKAMVSTLRGGEKAKRIDISIED